LKKLFYWIPSLVWMGAIFLMSSRTGEQLSTVFPFFGDLNWGHFFAYFFLSAFYRHALAKTIRVRFIPLWAVMMSLIYGITDEYHQSFIPGRNPELPDIASDLAGAASAAVLISLYQARKRRSKKPAAVKGLSTATVEKNRFQDRGSQAVDKAP